MIWKRRPEILESCQRPQKNVKSLSNKENPKLEPRSHDPEAACMIYGESFDGEWNHCNTCEDGAYEACVDINPADLYYNCEVYVIKFHLVIK